MRNKLIVLLILVVFFIIFVFLKFFILDKRNQYGQLRIISSPTATVFINNLAVGRTPFYEKYPVGDYILKLIPEGVATDTASWQGKINVYNNAQTFINRELGSSDTSTAGEILTITKMEKKPAVAGTGEIYVETEPQGAIVYLNNEEKGTASLILENILPGDQEISVFLPGFLRRTKKINVEAGYRVNAYFKLAIDPNAKKIIEDKTPSKEATTEAKKGEEKQMIVIKETPTGWLRVREEPSITASEAAKVKPGDEFELLDESNNWYKIEYEEGKFGWVSAEYATKK